MVEQEQPPPSSSPRFVLSLSLSPLRSTGCKHVPVAIEISPDSSPRPAAMQARAVHRGIRHSYGGPGRAHGLARRPACPSAAASGVGLESATTARSTTAHRFSYDKTASTATHFSNSNTIENTSAFTLPPVPNAYALWQEASSGSGDPLVLEAPLFSPLPHGAFAAADCRGSSVLQLPTDHFALAPSYALDGAHEKVFGPGGTNTSAVHAGQSVVPAVVEQASFSSGVMTGVSADHRTHSQSSALHNQQPLERTAWFTSTGERSRRSSCAADHLPPQCAAADLSAPSWQAQKAQFLQA